MNALDKLFAKLQGRDLEAEEETKKKASEGIADYESQTGTKYEEEPGLEPDEVTEGLVTLPFMGPASGMAKRAGGFAIQKAEKAAATSALDKLKEGGAPKPTFSEGVASGNTKPGAGAFSKWLRGDRSAPPPAGGGTLGKAGEALKAESPKGNPNAFNGLEKYGKTDTMNRIEDVGFIGKLRQLRDKLYAKEGMSERVKNISDQINTMKSGPSLNQATSATEATTGFKSQPGIYVNPKLK